MKFDAIRQAKGNKNSRKEKGELFVAVTSAKTIDEKYHANNQPQKHLKQVKYLFYVHVFKVYSNRNESKGYPSISPVCCTQISTAILRM